jgi:hypothetical protein
VKVDKANSTNLGWLLIGFAFTMAIGGVAAWAWLPEVQYSRNISGYKIPSKTLETMADGRRGVEDERMRAGFRNRARIAWGRIGRRS